MAVAGVIDLKWIIEGGTTCGRVCSAEGMLNLMGLTAAAFFTTAIAVQTWLSIYKIRHRTYSRAWVLVSAAVWVYVTLFSFLQWVVHRKEGLPGDGSDFYRPTPFWCSVNSDYRTARMVGQYVWLWACGFGSIIIYVPLYLFSRGNLDFEDADGKVRWVWHFPALSTSGASGDLGSRDSLDDDLDDQSLRSEAWKMLLYPCAYALQILGLSIVRWVTFITQPNGVSLAKDPTLGGYAAAHLVFSYIARLGGLMNVIIILTTRPGLLLFGSRGVLTRNDPRAQNDPRVRDEVPDLANSNPKSNVDFYLPQLDRFETGSPGQMQTPGPRPNCGS